MKRWWCMGCQAEVGLSKHGRCEVCDSEAVDSLPSGNELNGSVSMASTNADSVPASA
jgi:hypothetical protein